MVAKCLYAESISSKNPNLTLNLEYTWQHKKQVGLKFTNKKIIFFVLVKKHSESYVIESRS